MNTIARIVAGRINKNAAPYLLIGNKRCIATSGKNRETASVVNPSTSETDTICKTESQSKNWISYGFSITDQYEDKFAMHSLMFMGVSVVFVFGGFLLAYRPGDLNRDWAQREGYLELRRREKLNLPLVDPNYIPVDKLNLPSDEDLGDTEIII